MPKVLTGTVVSNKMQNTIIVEVEWKKPHSLYKKLLKRSKKYKVETNGKSYEIGQTVSMRETKPIAKDKHFVIVEVKDIK